MTGELGGGGEPACKGGREGFCCVEDELERGSHSCWEPGPFWGPGDCSCSQTSKPPQVPKGAGHLTGSGPLGPSQYPELEPCLTLGGGIPEERTQQWPFLPV